MQGLISGSVRSVYIESSEFRAHGRKNARKTSHLAFKYFDPPCTSKGWPLETWNPLVLLGFRRHRFFSRPPSITIPRGP